MKKIIFIIILGGFICNSCKKTTEKSEHFDYKIITADLDNFWKAYDALENSKDSIRTFQKTLIDKASPEFKKFIELRDITAKDYMEWVKYKPKFWKTVRPLTLAVKNKKPEIDNVYTKMKELYPSFKAPNICFAISPVRSGGTTSKGLILIGTEIAAVNPKKVDITEIDGFMANVFQNGSGDITKMIAHELVHTQQPNGDNMDESLISQAITEGSADFIATLIIGKQTMSKPIFKYGENHQQELWFEFKNDMKNKKMEDTDWFYDYHSNRPADLGYYIGYKIVESYYNKKKDKKQAIKEIIECENPLELLKKSGYDGKNTMEKTVYSK